MKNLDAIAGDRNHFAYEDREFLAKYIIEHVKSRARNYSPQERVDILRKTAKHKLITGKKGFARVEETAIQRRFTAEADNIERNELNKVDKSKVKQKK